MPATVLGPGLFVLVLFLLFISLWIVSVVFWIRKIIEVARPTDAQFAAAGQNKVVWLLIVVLLGWVGPLVWQLGARSKVLAAPPGGSYPGAWPGSGIPPQSAGYGYPPQPPYGYPPQPPAGWAPPPPPAGWTPPPPDQ